MSQVLKLAIPLLDDKLELSDFDTKTGFINGYMNDINNPALDSHIFLMYEHNASNKDHYERDSKLRKLSMLHVDYTLMINDKVYVVYAIHAKNKTLLRIKEGLIPLKQTELNKIFKFWNFKDNFINKLMFNRAILIDKDTSYIPEANSGKNFLFVSQCV